jgi:hypothetical protein
MVDLTADAFGSIDKAVMVSVVVEDSFSFSSIFFS